jgi:hypothetical protein
MKSVSVNKPISLKEMNDTINNITNLRKERAEKALVEAIEKYDFMVASKDAMYKLKEVLPDGANIVCSPYIEDSTNVYVIKKFDIMDYIKQSDIKREDKE